MTRIDSATVKATIVRAQTGANYDGTDDIVDALMHLVQEAQAEARDEGYADGFHDIDWAHTPNPYRNEAP